MKKVKLLLANIMSAVLWGIPYVREGYYAYRKETYRTYGIPKTFPEWVALVWFGVM